MALVAAAAEDDNNSRGRLFKIFQLGHSPTETPRRQEPSRSFFEVAGVDKNQSVQAGHKGSICAAMASIKLAY